MHSEKAVIVCSRQFVQFVDANSFRLAFADHSSLELLAQSLFVRERLVSKYPIQLASLGQFRLFRFKDLRKWRDRTKSVNILFQYALGIQVSACKPADETLMHNLHVYYNFLSRAVKRKRIKC